MRCHASEMLIKWYVFPVSYKCRQRQELMVLDCCAGRFLSLQSDFLEQRCEVDETITQSGHRVLYYPKFHCELNHIERFWCHSKQRTREKCDYSFLSLRQHVPEALASIAPSTILANYHSCMRRMQLYRDGVSYGGGEWKKLTSHQKVYVPGDDR